MSLRLQYIFGMSKMERIFAIDRAIRTHGEMQVRKIIEEFEVSNRQVKRDIEFMRLNMGAPLVYVKETNSYVYGSAWDALVFADESSFLAYVFLKAILTKYCYVPVLSKEKILQMKERIVGQYMPTDAEWRYGRPVIETLDAGSTFALCEGLLKESPLRISCRDVEEDGGRAVVIPLRLVNYSGKWYCVALECGSRGLKMYSVGRMADASLLMGKEKEGYTEAELPTEAAIDEFLNSSYGISLRAPVGKAVVRFHGQAARSIRHQEWHPDQRMETIHSEGAEIVQLTAPTHDWSEIVSRVLQYGADAEVVDPPELREQWRETIRNLAQRAGI